MYQLPPPPSAWMGLPGSPEGLPQQPMMLAQNELTPAQQKMRMLQNSINASFGTPAVDVGGGAGTGLSMPMASPSPSAAMEPGYQGLGSVISDRVRKIKNLRDRRK